MNGEDWGENGSGLGMVVHGDFGIFWLCFFGWMWGNFVVPGRIVILHKKQCNNINNLCNTAIFKKTLDKTVKT